jgi:hypothetical protein
VFDPSTASTPGWLCQSTAQTDLKNYGFTTLGPSCGSVTDEQLTFG